LIRLAFGGMALLFCAAPLLAQSDADVDARLTPTFKTCMNSDQGMSTYGMGACLGVEYDLQDGALNQRYKSVMARLSKARQNQLRQSQRQWIKTRDTKCQEAAAEFEGGTAAGPAFRDCLLRETVRRRIWLERYT
jgi:uncharacterized protein YecT (DUF1311 family)